MNPDIQIFDGKDPRAAGLPWARPAGTPDELDILKARKLALCAGSFLAGGMKNQAGTVIAHAEAVGGFLLGGGAASSYADLRARCQAVKWCLRNLRAGGDVPDGGCDPEWFLRGARMFYEFLTREQVLVTFPADRQDDPEAGR